MPPKGAATAAAKAAAKKAASVARVAKDEQLALRKAELAEESRVKRGQQSNMLTQIKGKAAGFDMEAKAFLEVYNSLGRFDSQKSDMLAKWEKDR